MNTKALLGSMVLAATAMTALPAVAGADDYRYSGSVGGRSTYTPDTPVSRTTSRVIRYGQPPIYVDYNRIYDRPVATRTVTYVTPSEPTYVYVDRGVSYRRSGYPVYRQRRIYTRSHRQYRPSYQPVHHRRYRSHGWGFNIGIHSSRSGHRGVHVGIQTGNRGHRGGGFGSRFNRHR